MRNVPHMSLADISQLVQYGYTASASDMDIGPKFLRITDIVPPQIDWDNVPHCKIDERKFSKFCLEQDDIVIARTGATVGYAKLIREQVPSVFASYLVRVRIDPEKADPKYVGRIVESSIYKRFVLSRVGGADQPNANAKILASFRLPIPGKRIQLRVAEILSAYDDLIENNQRRIALLEEAARLLYREWFVRFHFPDHEHAKIVDGLPEGWERSPFGQIAELKYGKALKQESRVEGLFPVYGSSGVVGTHQTPLVEGPAIVVGRKGNVGSIFWSPIDFWPIDTVYFIPKEQVDFWLYFALHSAGFQNTDAGVPGLNRDFAYSRKLTCPSVHLRRLFNEAVEPMFAQQTTLENYNKRLVQARDLLLPRLMNGEVTV